MSTRVDPAKFFVPELPDKYIFSRGQNSKAAETAVLRLLLEVDTAASPVPAIVVKGPGGTGKTTSLIAVGNNRNTCTRFGDAVWFIPLGRDAIPATLLEDLQTVVRAVVGPAEAEEIGILSRSRNKTSAIAEAIRLLNDHAVLLLFDDVWEDEKAQVVGQSTIFSLVQDCFRRLQRNPRRLRAVASTRDIGVASLVPETCRVSAEPFEAGDDSARDMLCCYAETSFEDIRTAPSSVQESFGAILDRCGGLQLALAVAGSAVRDRLEFGGVEKEEVWGLCANMLEQMPAFLRQTNSDHDGIFAMLWSSLEHVRACLQRDGVVLPDDVILFFSLLAVLKKKDVVPLSVVECIWGLSKETTSRVCGYLARMHLVSLVSIDGVQWMLVHDVILDFCDVLLSEKPGRKSFSHRMTVEGLEKMLLGSWAKVMTEYEWVGCAPWWKLCDDGLDKWVRDYCSRNLARHKAEAGGEYSQRLLYLVTDYRWIEARMKMTKQGNDLGGIVQDVQTFVKGCREELEEEVRRGLELISDAARLSLPYVANNPQELPYQLQGRLAVHGGKNAVVDRFLWTLGRYADRPWLKAGKGVLTAAGGPVVLSASLPKQLWCVAVLPNGEDVVVGGAYGYLAVFSIRYASELYELSGHRGTVYCVATCAARKRTFSGGWDGTIRVWEHGTGQEPGEILVTHEKKIYSLAVSAAGSGLVFGDEDGWLVVCDSTSGDERSKWRAHSSRVSSLAFCGPDAMIVSGSYDGTIGRWESASGEEVGTLILAGAGRVNGVAVSCDGKRIAVATEKKVVVLVADSGEVLRECDTNRRTYSVVFSLDAKTVHFGRVDGTTAALTPNGDVVCDVKAHSGNVLGIAQSHSSQLISVSDDCTLSVQKLERACSSPAAEFGLQYELDEFVVLPDRKRILYSWLEGPRGLWLLNLDTTSWETALGPEELINVSMIIGSTEAYVSAIAVSRDGRCAVAGTSEGDITVYVTDTWRPRYASLRRLPGQIWCAAISRDGTFLAAGSSGGSVALFRIKDGSEVQLPSSAGLGGRTRKIAFSEESSSLFAMVRSKSQRTGILHVWRHIEQAADIEHVALPFSRTSTWLQPIVTMSVIANSSHIATRERTESRACVYDFAAGRYSKISSEEADESGLLQVSTREHAAFESTGALFMAPFERTIKYRRGSGADVLGTLEAQTCHSFRPEQWMFDKRTGLFVTGGFSSRLVIAILMGEQEWLESSEPEEPKLPPARKAVARRVGGTLTGTARPRYNVFVSHAGPDKADIALPLYRRLVEKGINVFVDKEELRAGARGVSEMEVAMQTADIGVFITSPEFVCRQWPMRELACFLKRTKSILRFVLLRKPPAVLPVFYRLNVHECRSPDLFNNQDLAALAAKEGFFNAERQKEISTGGVLECMRGLAGFTGIENDGVVNDAACTEGRMENRMRREELLKRIVDGVVDARDRRDQDRGHRGAFLVAGGSLLALIGLWAVLSHKHVKT